jgi:hypothetical protein
MIVSNQFRPYRNRIRLLMFVDGLFWGLLVAAVLGVGWGLLDWLGVAFTNWSQIALLLGVGAFVGAVVRAVRVPDERQIASSIDRRAGLKDRLGTATSIGNDASSGFAEALTEDALGVLSNQTARKLYPVRFSIWYGISLVVAVVAFLILLLSNSTFFLSSQQLEERAVMKQEATRPARVAEPGA